MRQVNSVLTNFYYSFFALFLSGILFSGCIINVNPDNTETIRGSGSLVPQTVDINDFSKVSMAIPGELTISQGSEESLTITAQANLLPHIDIYVDEGRLRIETDDDVNIDPTRTIQIQLSVVNLNELIFAGSGLVMVDSLVTTSMAVTLAGSGDIEFSDLTSVELQTTLAGSGDMLFIGTVDEQNIVLAGSGDIEARDLESKTADIEIAGSGSATLNVSDDLRVSIVGSGSVRYLGNPTVETTIVGSGTVSPLGG